MRTSGGYWSSPSGLGPLAPRRRAYPGGTRCAKRQSARHHRARPRRCPGARSTGQPGRSRRGDNATAREQREAPISSGAPPGEPKGRAPNCARSTRRAPSSPTHGLSPMHSPLLGRLLTNAITQSRRGPSKLILVSATRERRRTHGSVSASKRGRRACGHATRCKVAAWRGFVRTRRLLR
jgi:hypothetical protein